ncbi:MAG TPA: YbaB/EbfC family nucleoid-associated protein [Coxiellaceae bacterium]|nr:YbaB/EbfC family nucleoid-associated protein [Coxiellaceae bacterium]
MSLNIMKLMQNAKKMQEIFQAQQKELESLMVQGEAGGGSVKVEMNGRYRPKKLHIDPDILRESPEVVEDLILAAFAAATEQVEKRTQEKMASATKMMDGGDLSDWLNT